MQKNILIKLRTVNEIPVGTVIIPEEYILEISGVVQTPYLAYEILSSGERKINFTEPPRRFLSEENDPNTDDDDIFVGRQFIGLLYQKVIQQDLAELLKIINLMTLVKI